MATLTGVAELLSDAERSAGEAHEITQRILRLRGDAFDDALSAALESPQAGFVASQLLDQLTDWRVVIVAAECAEKRVQGAEQALRRLCGTRGKGSRDKRYSAVHALTRVVGFKPSIDVILDGLEDRDSIVAEDVAITLEECMDPAIVDDLSNWLQRRMRQARTRNQARVTANTIATCLRLVNDASRSDLKNTATNWRLTPLEKLALDEQWRGHIAAGTYPEVGWPD